jgi:putative transcriptional regulator
MKYRFYLGYSGWGEGQLDDELERGMWVVAEYRRELLFCENPATVWETAVRQLGPDYRHWLDVPVNVSEN